MIVFYVSYASITLLGTCLFVAKLTFLGELNLKLRYSGSLWKRMDWNHKNPWLKHEKQFSFYIKHSVNVIYFIQFMIQSLAANF